MSRSPRSLLRLGETAAIILSPQQMETIAIGLLLYQGEQIRRVREAVEDGNTGHADARSRRLRIAEDLIDFMRDAGVRMLSSFRRHTEGPLPSDERVATNSGLGKEH